MVHFFAQPGFAVPGCNRPGYMKITALFCCSSKIVLRIYKNWRIVGNVWSALKKLVHCDASNTPRCSSVAWSHSPALHSTVHVKLYTQCRKKSSIAVCDPTGGPNKGAGWGTATCALELPKFWNVMNETHKVHSFMCSVMSMQVSVVLNRFESGKRHRVRGWRPILFSLHMCLLRRSKATGASHAPCNAAGASISRIDLGRQESRPMMGGWEYVCARARTFS